MRLRECRNMSRKSLNWEGGEKDEWRREERVEGEEKRDGGNGGR